MSPRTVWLVALASAGCLAQRGYPCRESEQCVLDGVDGICQESGWCSYEDDECESGQRYEELAPDELADACVEVEAEAELSCDLYCETYPTVCTGELSGYPDPETCLQHCAQWPVGDVDDRENDSLGCRQYHLTLAGMWSAPVNCARASPSGADTCRDLDPAVCSQYCAVFINACNDIAGVPSYGSMEECGQVCNSWYPGVPTPDRADSATCRLSRMEALADDTLSPEQRFALCIAGSRTGGAGFEGLTDDASCTLPPLP